VDVSQVLLAQEQARSLLEQQGKTFTQFQTSQQAAAAKTETTLAALKTDHASVKTLLESVAKNLESSQKDGSKKEDGAASRAFLEEIKTQTNSRLTDLEKQLGELTKLVRDLSTTLKDQYARENRNFTTRTSEFVGQCWSVVLQFKDWVLEKSALGAVVIVDAWTTLQENGPAIRAQAEAHASQAQAQAKVHLETASQRIREAHATIAYRLILLGVPGEYSENATTGLMAVVGLIGLFIAYSIISSFFACLCRPCQGKKKNGKKLKAEQAKKTKKEVSA
jgi:hypothetical protein